MKVKLDENLPASLGEVLVAHDHQIDTVIGEDLVGHPDAGVAAAARAEGRLLITLDKGFGDIRAYPPGTHPGILVLRLADEFKAAAPPARLSGRNASAPARHRFQCRTQRRTLVCRRFVG